MKKRVRKQQQKSMVHTSTAPSAQFVDIDQALREIEENTNDDPQGYVQSFVQYLKNPSCKLSESSADKYLRSFKHVVKV